MNTNFQEYLVLSFAAAVNFPVLAVVLSISNMPESVKKIVSLLIGSEAVLLLLGAIFVRYPNVITNFRYHHTFIAFDLIFGSLLIVLGLINFFKRNEKEKEKSADTEESGWKYFWMGFGLMIGNVNTLALYLPVIKNITLISDDRSVRILLLLLSNLIITIMIWLPLIFLLLVPDLVEKYLRPVSNYIQVHHKSIVTIVLLVVGAFLLFKGLSKM